MNNSNPHPSYPKYVHHANHEPRLVRDPEEHAALGEGWTEEYQHRSFPRHVFHPTKATNGKVVESAEELKTLGDGWVDSPEEFPETPAK